MESSRNEATPRGSIGIKDAAAAAAVAGGPATTAVWTIAETGRVFGVGGFEIDSYNKKLVFLELFAVIPTL